MAATPDKAHIPLSDDGEPNTLELVEGPSCKCGKCPPFTVFGYALKADAEYIERLAAKARALAVLAEEELPEGFDEMLEQMTAPDEDAKFVVDMTPVCWN